jgi:glycerate kinase
MAHALRVVVAPDSFKGAATADTVAGEIAAGWLSVRPGDEVVLAPMADGGEGTIDAFARTPGAEQFTTTVRGPDGADVDARWIVVPEGTAVVELAETSGLGLLTSPRPFDAHTVGLGELIVAALEAGASRLLIALGGSGSTDGGAGALTALGARLLDSRGNAIADGNRGLADLAEIDLSTLRAAPPGGVVLLADVRSPLLGDRGAARMFGAQKGATADEIAVLEGNVSHLLDVAARGRPDAIGLASAPGAGAAGGTGFGLMLWEAEYASGAAMTAEAIGLADHVRHADLVITGEGRFDDQTAEGKVVAEVARIARSTGTAVALIAGSIDGRPEGFVDVIELATLAGSPSESIAATAQWARTAGGLLAARVTV